jgi:hypothetical protein
METSRRKATSDRKSARSSAAKAVSKRSTQQLKTQRTDAATFKQTIYPYVKTGKHIIALAAQREREKESELYRDAVDIGSLFLAIDGESGPDGCYGALSVEELAKRIRPKVVMALDWLAQHGHPMPGGNSGLETLLGLLQQGVVPSASPGALSSPTTPSPDLSEVPDLVLSESVETALGIEEDAGFL